MANGPNMLRDADYRRGVILGLTMGEAILLLLFCLLLALALPLVKEVKDRKVLERDIEVASKRVEELDQTNRALTEVVRKLRESAGGKGIDDITKEYVVMKTQLERAGKKMALLEQKGVAFDFIAQQTSGEKPPPTPEGAMDVAKAIASKVSAYHQIRDALPTSSTGQPANQDPAQVKEAVTGLMEKGRQAELSNLGNQALVAQVRQAEARVKETEAQLVQRDRDLANTSGQLQNLRRQMRAGGRGVEKVPCWATEEGRSENIFDVALTSNGLIVRDRKLPQRQEEQKKLPLEGMVFDHEVSSEKLLSMTLPLFQWSEVHECRFFVRAFDLTAATEKGIYKRRLRIVGDRFYIYEELNEQF